ncbi:hypothetical protein M514_04958 [Trichuris suis]|uniref:Uncharacterized protein n=1 Tax=Trichuris suis TaxID=68888 RepID=A0A085NNZ7_9BILA|nr:hypothetical protein M513_04958 [Trichuris suis]KFD71193.1 hypothetical protein M514_04958 [Trichuris suis]
MEEENNRHLIEKLKPYHVKKLFLFGVLLTISDRSNVDALYVGYIGQHSRSCIVTLCCSFDPSGRCPVVTMFSGRMGTSGFCGRYHEGALALCVTTRAEAT